MDNTEEKTQPSTSDVVATVSILVLAAYGSYRICRSAEDAIVKRVHFRKSPKKVLPTQD